MSVKQPLSPIHRTDARKDGRSNQSRTGQQSYWKKVAKILLICLTLFLALTSPGSTQLGRQSPTASATRYNPIGDTTIVTGPGFDTCVAPPASLLQNWWNTSP